MLPHQALCTRWYAVCVQMSAYLFVSLSFYLLLHSPKSVRERARLVEYVRLVNFVTTPTTRIDSNLIICSKGQWHRDLIVTAIILKISGKNKKTHLFLGWFKQLETNRTILLSLEKAWKTWHSGYFYRIFTLYTTGNSGLHAALYLRRCTNTKS